MLCTLAAPVFAQYGGPAILSRGDAPTGVVEQQISFRPDFEISAIYDTGLAGAALTTQGQLGNIASAGLKVSGGISGNHSWRHTQLGLSYHGSINQYAKATYYDGSNQTLMLSLEHQLSRHLLVTFRENAGMLSTEVTSTALEEAIPYDPSQTILPATNFVDNRTLFLSTEASLTYQRSTRLSFRASGSGFLNRRRSSDLAGVTGASADGDIQYRISRRQTIGVDYSFSNYSFTRIFSGSDVHSLRGSYSARISKTVEFSGFAGVSRAETKSEQEVAVNPLIAALLGITSGLSITHAISYVPSASGRLSRTFHNGVAYVSGSRLVVPGNGLFLTSISATAIAGYSYTGLRNWSFTSNFNFNRSTTLGIPGNYGSASGRLSASHTIFKTFSAVASFTASQYESGTYSLYNRLIYDASVGLGWSPGDIPLRVW